jgi:hypothetical protein
MAVEAASVRDVHAAEDELSPGDELVNVVAYANMDHAEGCRLKMSGFRVATGRSLAEG